MRQILLFLTFTLLTVLRTEACVCALESIQTVRQRSIEQSDLIFTARVILTDSANGYFTLKVLKVYKGTIDGEVEASTVFDSLGTSSSCGFWPSQFWGNEFIVYANRVKGTKRIYIDDCSATRSLSNPNVHLAYAANSLKERKQKKLAKADLRTEIEILEKLNAR